MGVCGARRHHRGALLGRTHRRRLQFRKHGRCDLEKQAPDLSAANCSDDFANTAPVGSSKKNRFKPNPWGLYDMLGNVAEWVADCYEGNYLDAAKDNSPSSKPNCSTRVVRGGSWSSVPRYIRAARRDGTAPYLRSGDFGFRLGRSVAP